MLRQDHVGNHVIDKLSCLAVLALPLLYLTVQLAALSAVEMKALKCKTSVRCIDRYMYMYMYMLPMCLRRGTLYVNVLQRGIRKHCM